VKLADGRTLERTVEASRGDPDNPLTSDELRFKFRDAASAALPANVIEELITKLESVEDISDVRQLGQLLRRPAG
jgi:2-methylcitrate dehydratase PrpD